MLSKTKPLGFRKWLTLEKLKQDLLSAAENSEFPDKVFAYLSAALAIPARKLEKDNWENVVLLIMKASTQFVPDKSLPLLKDSPDKEEKESWDYDGRSWNYYSHLIAQAYGWTLEYIANLGVNEALSHLQEIMTDDQLKREFEYGLSEIAYPYNKTSKQSNFVPMKRPYWMRQKPKEVKKFKMKRSLLPMGMGVDVSGLPDSYGAKQILENQK